MNTTTILESLERGFAPQPIQEVLATSFENYAGWMLAIETRESTLDPERVGHIQLVSAAALMLAAHIRALPDDDRHVQIFRQFPVAAADTFGDAQDQLLDSSGWGVVRLDDLIAIVGFWAERTLEESSLGSDGRDDSGS